MLGPQTFPLESQKGKSGSNIIGGRAFHNTDSSYWLPNDDVEIERLNSQHFAIKSLFNGNFSAKVRDYVSLDDHKTRILDCGCGPGTWIMDVATENPNCHYFGIDISDVFPKGDLPSNVHFQTGDVLKGLPFDDNTFDFISLRLLILAFQVDEWSVALKELYRVLKPGGVIESKECDQLDNGSELVKLWVHHVEVFMENRGQDAHIVRRVPEFLHNGGFEVIETNKKMIHLGRSDPMNRALLKDVMNVYKNIKPYMAPQLGLETDEDYDDFLVRLAIECQQEPEGTWSLTSSLARKPL
ncbi:S-adenosyl-L-methionine-dependent methyltransferase [Chlamydoabsidia padenii]|nr:S-adenosyl-L-methionine-dependent methyltransferase [Chlamydoabsidia padenii]